MMFYTTSRLTNSRFSVKALFAICLYALFFESAISSANGNLDVDFLAISKDSASTAQSKQIKANENIFISFKIKGKYDQGLVSGLHPAAWIRPRLKDRSNCKDAVRNYLQIGANATQDIDLNSYHFLTLNEDNSIGIIDPKLNLATANLVALKKFQEKILDWHLDKNRADIYLIQSQSKQLTILNALTGVKTGSIASTDLPIKITPDEKNGFLWLTNKGSISVIDIKYKKQVKSYFDGSSDLSLFIPVDADQVWIYDDINGRLTAIDRVSLEVEWTRNLLPNLKAISYSSLSDRLYFIDQNQNDIAFLYPQEFSQLEYIGLGLTLDDLIVSPDGQWLFALDLGKNTLSIIELSTNRLKHQIEFRQKFDQLVFSDNYAYVRHSTSAKVSLIQLNTLEGFDSPSIIEVPFGIRTNQLDKNHFPAIISFPEGGAVLVNNAQDKTLYIYMEDGMLAPSNAFKIYTERPKSVLIHDKTIKETSTGLYQAVTLVPRPGKYEVVFYLDSPLMVSCFPLDVGGKGQSSQSIFQSPIESIKVLTKGYYADSVNKITLKFVTEQPLPNKLIKLLFFKPGSNWQKRVVLKTDKNTQVETDIYFPSTGRYLLAIESNELNLPFKQKNIKILEVKKNEDYNP